MSKKSRENKSKFAFDEIVKIINSKYDDVSILNSTGYIAGMAMGENHKWEYGVFLFEVEEVWRFDESELESTGKFLKQENFYDDASKITVIVDKDGKGHIK